MSATVENVVDIMRIISETTQWLVDPIPSTGDPIYWVGKRVKTDSDSGRTKITIYIGISQNCLVFQCPLSIYVLPDTASAVYHYLLNLNTNLRIGKFGTDESRELYLLAEVLLEGVNLQVVKQYLQALEDYFESYIGELKVLSQNSELAKTYQSFAVNHIPR